MHQRDDVASADQDEWVALFAAIRWGLRKLAAGIPDMAPCDAEQVVDASFTAMRAHINALSFDDWVNKPVE